MLMAMNSYSAVIRNSPSRWIRSVCCLAHRHGYTHPLRLVATHLLARPPSIYHSPPPAAYRSAGALRLAVHTKEVHGAWGHNPVPHTRGLRFSYRLEML